MNEFIPNSFQIANSVIDEYLSQMSGNALKCYILIVRKTRGWQKTHDSLSVSQIQKLTGIKSEETVEKAINELVELGLIGKQSRAGLPNVYFLISDPKKGVTPPQKNVPPSLFQPLNLYHHPHSESLRVFHQKIFLSFSTNYKKLSKKVAKKFASLKKRRTFAPANETKHGLKIRNNTYIDIMLYSTKQRFKELSET